MEDFKKTFYKLISEAETIAVGGHIKPDGDCIGACFGMHRYLLNVLEKDKERKVDIIVEGVPRSFECIVDEADKITDYNDKKYDLFIALDCGDAARLGKAEKILNNATQRVVIDHHITNPGFGMYNLILPESSSTCEILCQIFDFDRIDQKTAEYLYLGIVHDTGVFKHSCTTESTMTCAGRLISKGVVPNKVIDGTFYEKTYLQNQLMGRCLMESILVMDGQVVVSGMSKKMQDFYGVTSEDFEGIIDQLRITKGVEVAIVIREERPMMHKVSMRSNNIVNVGQIAAFYGGGGHVRAAGCTMHGTFYDVANNLTGQIEAQLENR